MTTHRIAATTFVLTCTLGLILAGCGGLEEDLYEDGSDRLAASANCGELELAWTTDFVNFRSSPNGSLLRTLPIAVGKPVCLTGERSDDWLQIQALGMTGWVHGDYIFEDRFTQVGSGGGFQDFSRTILSGTREFPIQFRIRIPRAVSTGLTRDVKHVLRAEGFKLYNPYSTTQEVETAEYTCKKGSRTCAVHYLLKLNQVAIGKSYTINLYVDEPIPAMGTASLSTPRLVGGVVVMVMSASDLRFYSWGAIPPGSSVQLAPALTE